jgi:hypothetical protein
MKFEEPIWKCIITDAKKFTLGMERNFSFFDEGNETYSTHSLHEDDIVNIIYQNQDYLELLLKEAGIKSPSVIFKHIPRKQIFGSGSGDFDLVIYGPNYPFQIISFEFKRIKVEAIDLESDNVNKLKGIDTLFNQLEERVKMGFYVVYGVIIIHSDLRERKSANTILRSQTLETTERLFYEINNIKSFPNEAGLILLKFEQPTGKEYALNFKVGILKYAMELMQKDEITDRFQNFLNKNIL